MKIWHVQKIYAYNGFSYEVLPYDFVGTLKITLKMKNGIRQMIKFLSDSRWIEKAAKAFCDKKNNK